jgi:hypothetical protein
MEQNTTIFVGLGLQEALIILAVLVVILFHILMLIHVLRRKNVSFLHKLVWSLVIIFLPILGAVVYRFSAYSK